MKWVTKDLGDYETAYIIPFSDLHIGDPRFDADAFCKLRDWIAATDNAFCLFNGDIVNNAIKSSVSNVYEEVLRPRDQVEQAVRLLEPIKDKILCLLDGNHERRSLRECDYTPVEAIASKLGVTYAGAGAVLKLKVGKRRNLKPWVYTWYVTHGSGGGRTEGSVANAMKRLQGVVQNCDAYIMGHQHVQITFKLPVQFPDLRNEKVTSKWQHYICTGSFLQWGGYAEEKCLPPRGVGVPRVMLRGDEFKQEVAV